MRSEPTTTARRIRRLLTVGFVVALGLTAPVDGPVQAVGATVIELAVPAPTDPPVDEPPEEPAEPEDETAPGDDEPALEPAEVSAAVWFGAILLLVAAVAWALRQSSKTKSSAVD